MGVKSELIRIVIYNLELEINRIQESIDVEHKSMIDSPSAMQSWSDTTRSQKEDLLNGLNTQLSLKKMMFSSLKQMKVEELRVVQIGSLVKILNNENIENYCILPGRSSQPIILNEVSYHITSPQSLIAKSLYNHIKGDQVKVQVPAGNLILTILDIE